MMKQLNVSTAIFASLLLVSVGVDAFQVLRDSPIRRRKQRGFASSASALSTPRFQTATSWEGLAAEWKARNRDDEFSAASLQTQAGADPLTVTTATSAAPSSILPQPIMAAPIAATPKHVDDISTAQDIWDDMDTEIQAMQYEADNALAGLELMEQEMNALASELRAKDDNYLQQIRDMTRRGDKVEADLQQELDVLSRDFEAYRVNTEQQRQALARDAESNQAALRSQMNDLQTKLQTQMAELQREQTQSAELQKERERLNEELQRQRDETVAQIQAWQARVQTEQDMRERERKEFQTRLQQIQEDASRRIESTIQQVSSEKAQIERDYSSRLSKVSDDLRIASENLAQAQKIMDEKQKYIDTLEPAVSNLDDWAQESWFQLTRLQDAVGLPVTPLDATGEIPGVETLEAEAQNLIQHLRTRERYFEDAIFDIQTEMQNKKKEMKEQLSQLEKEYQEYREDMRKNLDQSREGAALARRQMQKKLDDIGNELQEQRSYLQEETQRAKAFMSAKIDVEKELEELKKEASIVIDGLENRLELEKHARRKESEQAMEALEKEGKMSMKNMNRILAQGKARMQRMEKEFANRVSRTEKELKLSKLTSGMFASVALTSIAVTGLVIMRSNSAKDPPAPKTESIIEQLKETTEQQKNEKIPNPPHFFLPREVVTPFRPKTMESPLGRPAKAPPQNAKTPNTAKLSAEAPASIEEDENKIDTSPNKNFFYAIKEEDGVPATSSQGEPTASGAPDTPTAASSRINSRTIFGIKGEETELSKVEPTDPTLQRGEKSKTDQVAPSPSTRPIFAIKEEGSQSPQDVSNAPASRRGEESKVGQESPSIPLAPDPMGRTIFAIKEGGSESNEALNTPTSWREHEPRAGQEAPRTPSSPGPQERTYLAIKEDVVRLPAQTSPAEPIKSPETPSVPSRTYFAIKEEGMQLSHEETAKGFPNVFSGPSKSPAAPVETQVDATIPAKTEDSLKPNSSSDDDARIDWDRLTNKWLDEISDIQSRNARAIFQPTKLPNAPRNFGQGTQTLDNPLLQQALAPPSPNDPFGRTASK